MLDLRLLFSGKFSCFGQLVEDLNPLTKHLLRMTAGGDLVMKIELLNRLDQGHCRYRRRQVGAFAYQVGIHAWVG
ncbi:hypothetical protein D3C77_454230 [compost metagenome]